MRTSFFLGDGEYRIAPPEEGSTYTRNVTSRPKYISIQNGFSWRPPNFSRVVWVGCVCGCVCGGLFFAIFRLRDAIYDFVSPTFCNINADIRRTTTAPAAQLFVRLRYKSYAHRSPVRSPRGALLFAHGIGASRCM